MEKSQYELCIEVLRRFNKHKLLDDVILIGSWCIPFYKDYFSQVKYTTYIKTRDVDFLIPNPHKIRASVDIPGLLKDLGFVIGYKGSKGYIKLEHSDLIVEFLSLEKGKGTDRPVEIPKLGINAVALRFLSLLTYNNIKVKVDDFKLSLPHPANFALHKLIIFQRRLKQDKAIKDRNAAIQILKALINKKETGKIKQVFDFIPKKWQKKILENLKSIGELEIIKILR
ncbi:GSU2403 family nucleotidyltransferase fold protein [Candidatus Omnitrophota bacterium]